MEAGIFDCPAEWEPLLPPNSRRLEAAGEVTAWLWPLLVLTASGCRRLERRDVRCGILLAPGDCAPEQLARIHAEKVVTYGLSPRDSLTLSSLQKPVLCVQRELSRPDGAVIEPGEFPLPPLPAAAAALLPLLGLRLLQMPLTDEPFLW